MMSEFRTTGCQSLGHAEIAIFIDEKSGLSPDWLISFFESEVRNGAQFKENETVQIGWLLTSLRKSNDSGVLEVWEPEFDSFPVRWCRGVTNTLRHLTLQKSVCMELHVEPCFPSMRQAGTISPRFLDVEGVFQMSREVTRESNSGWVFSSQDSTAGQLELRSLFDLSFHQPKIVPFLALPSGASVNVTLHAIRVCCAGLSLSSQNSDLLKGLLDAPVFV